MAPLIRKKKLSWLWPRLVPAGNWPSDASQDFSLWRSICVAVAWHGTFFQYLFNLFRPSSGDFFFSLAGWSEFGTCIWWDRYVWTAPEWRLKTKTKRLATSSITVQLSKFFILQLSVATRPARAVTFFEASGTKSGPLAISGEDGPDEDESEDALLL